MGMHRPRPRGRRGQGAEALSRGKPQPPQTARPTRCRSSQPRPQGQGSPRPRRLARRKQPRRGAQSGETARRRGGARRTQPRGGIGGGPVGSKGRRQRGRLRCAAAVPVGRRLSRRRKVGPDVGPRELRPRGKAWPVAFSVVRERLQLVDKVVASGERGERIGPAQRLARPRRDVRARVGCVEGWQQLVDGHRSALQRQLLQTVPRT